MPNYNPIKDAAIDPYERLAASVIKRAVLDLQSKRISQVDRKSAYKFLISQRNIFADCCGINPAYLRLKAKQQANNG